MKVNTQESILQLPAALFQNGQSVTIGSIKICKAKDDDLFCYATYFLQHYFLIMYMKDAVAEGDIFRVNIALKMMMPYFYAHSSMSKYFVECVDYILKTEILLPPQLSLEVRTSSFVNPRGGKGNNKASDLQKENQVKELKELIRGLGANKTEKSIVNVCKASPIIDDIIQNLDSQILRKDVNTTHKKRSDTEDFCQLMEEFRDLKPMKYKVGRSLSQYKCSLNVYEELGTKKTEFHEAIMHVANRLERNIPIEVDIDDESDVEEEDDVFLP